MRSILKGAIGFALAALAVPALAGERDCVASADPAYGALLVDQFFSEQGMGDAPAGALARLQGAIKTCIDQNAVTEEDSALFIELNLAHAMVGDLRKRLKTMGVDVDLLDRSMVPHIRSADTTFDEMFDSLGQEFQDESEKFAQSGTVDANLAAALVGSYAGAFHSAHVAQLLWSARR